LHLNYVSLADGNALLTNCVNPGAPTYSTCQAQDLGRAPKLQYTVGAMYEVGLPADTKLSFDANYGFVDDQQSSSSTANSVLLPSYGALILRAQVTPASAMWSAALVATNVTDKYYYTSGGNLSGFYGTKWAAPGRPREVGVEVKVRF
jgi:iron complex outermembrane receptor protein